MINGSVGVLSIELGKRDHVVSQFTPTFCLTDERSVTYEMSLDGEALFDLLRMTPNYWHSSDEVLSRARAMESVRAEASFTILMFRRQVTS